METRRVKEVGAVLNSKPGLGTWQERTPGLWVCQSFGEEHLYFSLEGWQVIDLDAIVAGLDLG